MEKKLLSVMAKTGEDLGSCFNRIAQIIEANPTQVGSARSLAQRFLADTQPPPMVKATPEQRYENRTNRKEMAPDFIRRVYGHLLDGNFTRADFRRIDESAETALRAWEQRHHRLSLDELNLPTVEERNTRLLEAGIGNESDPLRRKALKHIAAMRAYKTIKYKTR